MARCRGQVRKCGVRGRSAVIFVTVGSMFPFDRLIRAVDQLAERGMIESDVVAQIGNGGFEPRNLRFERFLPKARYEQMCEEANALIAHAGAGTIGLALAHHKPLLVVPRLKRYGEHVNDHQVATARKFEALGHVLAAYEVDRLADEVGRLAAFVPRPRIIDPERMARRIGHFIEQMTATSGRAD